MADDDDDAGDDGADADADDAPPPIEEGASGIERHPDESHPAEVAPNDFADTKALNTVRQSLASIACWRLDDHRFEFDSSFILPETTSDLQRLAEMFDDFKDAPMSIFGHADPVGTDDYNKRLSGFRAKSTFALLTRNLDMWEELHNEHGWGLKSTQQVLYFLEDETELTADGKDTPAYRDVVKQFQDENDLKVDGDAGKNTRRKLYELYMDAICVHPSGEPFKVEKTSFLGKGASPKGKADFQGCSEFNPTLLLSEDETKELKAAKDDAGRNVANAPNRRVVLYFFPPKTEIDPAKWPCPRADEGSAGCRKRFWSDHDKRIKPAKDERRNYKETRDTFACRFYDRFAFRSPCEAGFREWVVQLFLPSRKENIKIVDHEGLPGVPFVARGNGRVIRGRTDGNGLLRVRLRDEKETLAVELTIPVEPPANDADKDKDKGQGQGDTQTKTPPPTTKVVLTFSAGDLVELDPGTRAAAIIQRLRNLGYGPIDVKKWATDPAVVKAALAAFQKDHGLGDSGDEDDTTLDKLREVYGS